ncbi:MAG: type II toxin-antitoxin system VapB family antitoxin [Candidatus Marinimicrobia bacterium]|nr:type II toxin-antitoxin system VapB family antitoxin [Candidatus Neomarinimicrobiota bacterium]
MMRTTLDLDEKLIQEAMEATGVTVKKAVIEMGLKEVIIKANIKKFLDGIGSIKDFDLDIETIRNWRDQEIYIIEQSQINDTTVS